MEFPSSMAGYTDFCPPPPQPTFGDDMNFCPPPPQPTFNADFNTDYSFPSAPTFGVCIIL